MNETRYAFTSRVMKAARAMRGKPGGKDNRLIGILAGIKLAREYPEAAEAFLVQIGSGMTNAPGATEYLAALVEYIGTGRTSNEQVQNILEHLPED